MTENDVEKLLKALHQEKVEYVIIGGVAAVLQGFAYVTADLDLCYSREKNNLERLARALAPFKPYPRGAPKELPFHWDASALKSGFTFTLTTDLGDVDILGEVTGLGGYREALAVSEEMGIFGVSCRVLTLEGLIKAKRAAGRAKDLRLLPELETVLEARLQHLARPKIVRESVRSSAIVSVGYDPYAEMLDIEYVNGAVYRYYKVPKHVYLDLMTASSKGALANLHIKPYFSYEDITRHTSKEKPGDKSKNRRMEISSSQPRGAESFHGVRIDAGICRAIKNKAVLRFKYGDVKKSIRTVEPQCHGISSAGKEVLRAVQTSGYSGSTKSIDGKMFEVAKIYDLEETGEHLLKPAPHHNPKDKGMKFVHCCLPLAKTDKPN